MYSVSSTWWCYLLHDRSVHLPGEATQVISHISPLTVITPPRGMLLLDIIILTGYPIDDWLAVVVHPSTECNAY